MRSAWSGRPVLVTGAGGFIGSHLVERLAAEGAQVRALLRYTSRREEGNLKFLNGVVRDQLECLYGDLRDPATAREAVRDVDTVFHLAASISIPYSYAHPGEVVETNVGGTMNILQAGQEGRVRRVILTSSSEVYGTAQYVPIDELHPLQPQSPYAASKVAADMLGLSFYRSYGLPVAIVRPFNTYGPRQSMRAVIPTIVTQALTQETIKLGALHPTRDFLYVEDTVEAFLTAALHDEAVGEIVNFGFGATISIGELAEQVIQLVGRRVRVESVPDRLRPERSEVLKLHASRVKAERLLGWTPSVPLREGLSRTIAWISEHVAEFEPSVYYT
jgi:dTDP-glucose 4,6-dehydratase